jgi:hypothetical protein
MRRQTAGLAILVILLASLSFAQTGPVAGGAGVPPVIRFSGTLAVAPGRVMVTFGLYQQDTGGEPLWSETRTVLVDATGRFTVVLGTKTALPMELFEAGEARWLDVAVEGVAPQPRRLLVSVPYALKAADAETIGGKPLSAFVLAGEKSGVGADGLTYVDTRVLSSALASPGRVPGSPSPLGGSGAAGGAGSANYVGLFSDETTLVNSVIYQTPAGSIGVNTTTPAAGFHAVSAASPVAYYDVYSNALGALPVVYRAARGTPSAPTAVQANDILGGLAVRGYGTTAFSTGRGQVMYKAAENWTDTAQGTYLQFTSTPLGGTGWSERMRVAPDGKVGIGTAAPAQMLSVAGTIESTTGGFKFPDGTTQTTAGSSLAANTFAGTQTISSGNLALPATASASSGVLTLGGQPFLHGYGATIYPNTFVGTGAGTFTGTGNGGNVGVGGQALMSNTSGQYNTAVGMWALSSNTTGATNTAVGGGTLYRNTSATNNTAVGYAALGFATTGGYNSAVGAYALANSGASNDSAFGFQALFANTTGHDNDAFGYQTLMANTTGNYNVALGSWALRSNQAGSYNTSVGRNSLVVGTGDSNTALGYGGLYHVTTGTQNTAVGTNSGYYVTAGSSNTFLGYYARTDAAHANIANATAVGANSLVTQSNSLVLGGVGVDAVNVGIGTSAPDTTLQVFGDIKVGTSGTNGCLKNFAGTQLTGTCSSDLRLKTDVRPFGPMLAKVAQLQPVHFTWRASEFPGRHYGNAVNSGLIAQDVEQVFPELVSTDDQGFKTVNYGELPYLTLQAVKELKAKSDRLEAENDALKAQLAALAERLNKLEKR